MKANENKKAGKRRFRLKVVVFIVEVNSHDYNQLLKLLPKSTAGPGLVWKYSLLTAVYSEFTSSSRVHS